ncbi:hypothetical protein [Ferrovibrio sp.]|uniref:hypothetical protein n=1 Tax=Ferrovibrio sp. TaxID=1917215 RepID=UPI001B5E3DCF|nr:hypothetical protein [Ferrovibrio sp.]MBP7065343.1 hypothetical protein [Ferrovibrio sp.]
MIFPKQRVAEAAPPSGDEPFASDTAATQSRPSWRREPVRLSGRASPRRYDWPRAAKLLAAGTPAGEVAEALGCDEARVWRHLKASAIFRGMVEKEAERNRLLHGLRMQALRRSHAEALLTRADLAPETIERLVAALPEVTGAQLAAAARRPTAPNRKAAARLENERQNSQALLSANQIMRDVVAARREFRAAMAPASPSPMPVTKTPECPGSATKPGATDAKPWEAAAKPQDVDMKRRAAAAKPPQVVPEGCEALYYHGLFVPIMPEYWGQEMGPGWSLTPDPQIPGEP